MCNVWSSLFFCRQVISVFSYMIHLQCIFKICYDIFVGKVLILKAKKVFRTEIDLFCARLSIDEDLSRRGKMEVKTWQEFFLANPKGIKWQFWNELFLLQICLQMMLKSSKKCIFINCAIYIFNIIILMKLMQTWLLYHTYNQVVFSWQIIGINIWKVLAIYY